jgi:hypothetical protein
MLYVADMRKDIGTLMRLLASETLKNFPLADQYCNESSFSSRQRFGKNTTNWVHLKHLQYLVVSPSASKG